MTDSPDGLPEWSPFEGDRTSSSSAKAEPRPDVLAATLAKVWGFDGFRPLQAEAVAAMMASRDSLVVLPTGGGKSLCYQLPALCRSGLTVVVSPLIALMTDQVSQLTDRGVPAAAVNSTLAIGEKRTIASDIRAGRLKLLYVAPETLMRDRMLDFLAGQRIAAFAIDEAHCISDWGHDFRPEYRMLSQLKTRFPGVGIHGFTATATGPVRADIVRELGLTDPLVLVGDFDRPNLTYRVVLRTNLLAQVREILDRHEDESGVIYCVRRADVDQLTRDLTAAGYSAVGYHAGLSDSQRHEAQHAFLTEKARLIVATVAFGMGIDKSNVRFVIHAALPKSLEGYQQESGRAGRDGLEAECVLLYGRGDGMTWRRLQDDKTEAAHEIAMTLLDRMEQYATNPVCRHRALVEYFGQPFAKPNCGACDVCLGEVSARDDSLVLAQKILSGVIRTGERFGLGHNADVLVGAESDKIAERGHDRLSTHGVLSGYTRRDVMDWMGQLVAQGYLVAEGQYRTLAVTPLGREVLRGEGMPRLTDPAPSSRTVRKSATAETSWQGVDRSLFDRLRRLRKQLADAKGVPPFVVFSDATLRDLAKRKPTTPTAFLACHGVGEAKLAQYGEAFLDAITGQADVEPMPDASPSRRSRSAAPAPPERRRTERITPRRASTPRSTTRSVKSDAEPLQEDAWTDAEIIQVGPDDAEESFEILEDQADEQLGGETPRAKTAGARTVRTRSAHAASRAESERLLRAGTPLGTVAEATGRARSTVVGDLLELLRAGAITDISPWVPEATARQILTAASQTDGTRLRPIFDALGGDVPFDQIRLTLASGGLGPADDSAR